MVVLRVPYPMGFYAKGSMAASTIREGGTEGRGLWASNGDPIEATPSM